MKSRGIVLKEGFLHGLVFMLLFMLSVPAAFSIGISSEPMPYYYFFTPNMEISMEMKCYDYADDCLPYAEGEFSENVMFGSLVQTGDNEKSFSVKVNMPPEAGAPGEHRLYLGVSDVKNTASSGISVLTKVRKIMRFMILYEEKYVQASFSAPNINENEVGKFTFTVSNFGKPDLMLVYGQIDIFNDQGEKIGTAKSGSRGLKSTESKTLTAEWDSKGIKAGQHTAVGILYYDGNEKLMNQTFLIGMKDVSMINYTDKFEEGRISRMDINVKNSWNGPINDLHSSISVNGTEFKTPSITMGAFGTGTLTGYLDATMLKKGRYDAEIKIYFDGSEKTQAAKIEVFKPKGKGVYLPMQLGLNTTTLLIGAILLLVIFNMIMLLWMRKKRTGP
ncbi:hypothetical protein COV19_07055 [Candidatus Woesearchaeota archaeon CG10_big_fil_rev_8_21_14_0_10_44_13]|nr:MAG: hypothetical protein COV19_07055 [Candidatus Woesearchaeota archaeon CG10_big_fil_rev_8_21_14_0_10_44_13]